MAAPTDNQNAKKARTRVAVALSISDEKDKKRLSWAIVALQAQGIAEPTDAQIIRYVKDFCYARIDAAMAAEQK